MALESLKLFRLGAATGVTNPQQSNKVTNNFVKNTFNFGEANPNRPNTRVSEDLARNGGGPAQGNFLYCLG